MIKLNNQTEQKHERGVMHSACRGRGLSMHIAYGSVASVCKVDTWAWSQYVQCM